MLVLFGFVTYSLLLTVLLAANGLRRLAPRPVTGTPFTPTRILVIGATGGTGRHLVTQALDRGLLSPHLVGHCCEFHIRVLGLLAKRTPHSRQPRA